MKNFVNLTGTIPDLTEGVAMGRYADRLKVADKNSEQDIRKAWPNNSSPALDVKGNPHSCQWVKFIQ
ncbi:hypothetical protein [Pedobacter sp. Leaf194]|uniref:hypothetical protein n=1 Tax=Pedobacter sp. Leaf194 TaxID=1736297 RepID=UPI00070390BA|nr:hypothetical protein [Pedobacter sp. Leaf194]KQS36212.1 hypothetical protein ASG14_12345 [Pedobacter sp. Leaf194]